MLASWLGHISHIILFFLYHVTLFQKKTTSALTTCGEFSMDNELKASLTLLSLLAAVVQLNICIL